MNTAKIIYEQYKVLPKKVRKELKNLILNEDEADNPISYWFAYVKRTHGSRV